VNTRHLINSISLIVLLAVRVAGQSPTNTAQFLRADMTTYGSWKGVYGSDGYNVIDDTTAYPSYVTVTPSGQHDYVWDGSLSQPRALQKAGSATDRIAATWFNGGSFSVDMNFSDTATHQLALYFLDWDGGRTQTVSILDAVTNSVLDTQSLTSFTSGEYLLWNVTGHVIVVFTQTGAYNAVVSGLFFDPQVPVAPPVFSPMTGTYVGAQAVTISTATPGASIRYTTDGSTPSETAGTVYSGPITVSSTATINAIAYLTGIPDSAIAAGSYTIASSYSSSWGNRKLITVDHTKVSGSSNLTNFPVLISLTDADLATVANGGGVGLSDGRDILFTADDGATKLNHETESYNPSTGQLIAWVQVPTVSPTTDTAIYIYYGNTSAGNQQNPTGVWDSNYAGVWHFANGTTLNASDSTSHGNNGTIAGATAAPGLIDGGANFNGGAISESATTNTNVSLLSVSIWMKSAQAQQSSSTAIFDRRGGPVFNNWILDTSFYGNTYQFCITDDEGSGPSTGQYCLSSGTLDTDWHYVVGTYDGTIQTLYLDGTAVASNPVSITLGSGSYPLNWGSANGSGQFFNGLLDEARFSGVARSAGWISTEYNNQSSPSTFYTVGSKEGSGLPPQVGTPTFSPVAGTYSTAQTVTINTTTSGASIRYTTDASTPSETAGTLYSSPITVSTTTTIKAIAYASGMTDSQAASAIYTINNVVATPTISPAGGTYTSAQSVTLTTTTAGASIRYTTDGSTPSETAGTLYSGPITVTTATTIQAIAYASGMIDSAVASASYAFSAGSWSNPLSTGDRRKLIIATSSGFVHGDANNSVNGDTTENNWYFGGVSLSDSVWIQWDFGNSVIVDEAKFYQQDASGQGTWKWQGSDDGSSWIDIGSSFSLGGAVTQNLTQLNGNATPHRFYRMVGVSDSTNTNPWVREFEFHVNTDSRSPSYANPLASGERRQLVVATASPGLVNGDIEDSVTGDLDRNNFYFNNTALSGSVWLQWDFGNSVVIDAARLYQTSPVSQGTWKWQGSNSALTWTDLGSSFELGDQTASASAMGNNVPAYRYYRLLGVSGSTNDGPWIRQFEFHAGLDNSQLSYSNVQGSGNRTSTVTATASSGLVSGDITHSVDGNIDQDDWYFHTTTLSSDVWIQWDFGAAIIVDEARFYQEDSSSQGVWKWQGSNDASAWSDIGGSFALGGVPLQVIASLNGNNTAYRYYRIAGVSGSTSSSPWIREFEFHCGTASTTETATPTFSPVAGTYGSAQTVTISTTTSGASINYTTDGSTPSETTGTLYTGTFTVSATTGINAIAYATGMTDSTVASATYTITSPAVATPTFSPAAGVYGTGQTVTISTSTSGASIRYTTDGSTPSETAGTLYSGPITVGATTTINAIAYASGMTDSAVAPATYTIAGWYNTSWSDRKSISIAHTKVSGSSSLTNFPVLVSLTDANLATVANGGNAGLADGTDILFTASDGATKLNHEIESYNPSTGQLIAWVRVPSVSSTADTVIYIYYGDASATNQQNPTGVWDSNYLGVYHLSNGTTLSGNDSTANENNANTGTDSATAGKIDGAASNTSTSPYISMPALGSFSSATFSTWLNANTLTSAAGLIFSRSGSVATGMNLAGNQHLGYTWDNNDPNTYSWDSGLALPTGSWVYAVVTISPTGANAYLGSNGSIASASQSYTENAQNSGAAWLIGSDAQDLIGRHFDGSFDEVRISNIARSADWIATEYNNQSSPSTFYSVGSQQASGEPPPVATPMFSPTAETYGSAQTVTISTTTSGAAINYTTDGSTPSETAGTLYSGPITLSSTSTIKAIAYATGMTDSTVASATYTITTPAVAMPTFSPAAGVYSTGQTVTISTTTSGASIRYTTDGSAPSETAGTLYSGPITVSSTTAINAIAYASGMTDSAVAPATYTIAGWYNTSWGNREAITIDHTKLSGSSNLTNFPVLVSMTDVNLATVSNGGGVGVSDGSDILFTAADGATKLNYEIETYNPTTGQLIAWVQVPTVSPTTDTVMYIYYGNTSATNQQNPAGVWDASYKAVWHLPNGTTLSANDSTSNSYNGTLSNSPTATSGRIDGAASFSGSATQYIATPYAGPASQTPFTASFWIATTSTGQPSGKNAAAIMGWGDGNSCGAPGYFVIAAVDGLGHGADNTGLQIDWPCYGYQQWPNAIAYDGNWQYVVLACDGSSCSAYRNGALQSGTATQLAVGTGDNVKIAMGDFGDSGPFTGQLDEVRISTIARSLDWIATEYNNQSSPSTFFSVGSQQGSGAPPQVNSPTFSPVAGTYASAQTVTITTTTSEASIKYTTDGSTPSETAGTPYSGPITVSATTTINAIAYVSGMTDSSVRTVTYTMGTAVTTPQFSPSGGNYASAQTMTIHTSTSGASINYTTDGSTPSRTVGTLYTGPITIGSTTTLNAIAYASGYANSNVATGVYNIVTASNVTSLSPTSGAGGMQVTISGSGFGTVQGTGTVWLGSTLGAVASWSDTQIVATVALNSRSGFAYVQQWGVRSNSVPFNVSTATISSVSPASGGPGTQITISGSGFGAAQGGGQVWLGTANGVVQSWSDIQVVALVATGSGSGNAQVLQNGVMSNPVPFSVGTPQITALSPTSGSPGASITFTGTGFGPSQGSGTVQLGSTAGQVVSWSDTQVVATVASTALTGIARVQQGGMLSNALSFTVSGGSPVTLSPNLLNMVVGDTHTIQALNPAGQSVTGLTWASSDSTVVSLSTDDPPILTALAAGHVTITAGTASADVTVFADALPLGTVLWSDPGLGGVVSRIVPAVPSPTGVADVFAFNDDAHTVQAITSDGTTAWTASGVSRYVVPDFQGGLVGELYSDDWSNGCEVMKWDGLTGQATSLYSPASCGTVNVHTDGTVFVGDFSTRNIIGINSVTGAQFTVAGPSHSNYLNMIIAGDGYVYTSYGYATPGHDEYHEMNYFTIVRIDTAGSKTEYPVWAQEGPIEDLFVPHPYMITNADNGIVFTVTINQQRWIGSITNGTVSLASGPQIPGQDSDIVPVLQMQDGSFVGEAIVTGQDGLSMVAFDQNGNVRWSVPNYVPLIATADAGVIAVYSDSSPLIPESGPSGTFDQNGNATGQLANVQIPSWTSNTYQIGSIDGLAAIGPTIAASWMAMQLGVINGVAWQAGHFPIDSTSNFRVKNLLTPGWWRKFANSRCGTVFGDSRGLPSFLPPSPGANYSLRAAQKKQSMTNFYDIANAGIADLTRRVVTGGKVQSDQTIEGYLGNATAATDNMGYEAQTAVLLKAHFFSTANPQFTLAHEIILHAYVGVLDDAIFDNTFFKAKGLWRDPNSGATTNITTWMSTDCTCTPGNPANTTTCQSNTAQW
jgi:hypothetical protein